MGQLLLMHDCPICGRRHEVNEARASVAYGRQLTCSPECEGARRRLARGAILPDCISEIGSRSQFHGNFRTGTGTLSSAGRF